MSVEFYPSLEDHVHIALRISSSARPKPLTRHAYNFFLTLNAIVFPSFLFFNDYMLLGLVVFGLNLVALLFIVPRVNPDTFRSYYSQLYGHRENKIARVDLTDNGIRYTADGGEGFWPWHRINDIEETDDAIYFYFDGNGFAVRKAGFAYLEEKDAFVEFARRLQTSVTKELAR